MSICVFAHPLEIESVGLRAGAVSPSMANISTFSVGFRGETALNAASVFFQPYFDYWAAAWQTNETDQHWRFLSAGVSAVRKYHFNNAKPEPFLGGGIGVNMNIFSQPINGQQAAAKNSVDVDLSLHALAGFLFPLDDNFTAVIELKYVAAGRADYAGLWLGVNYRIIAR